MHYWYSAIIIEGLVEPFLKCVFLDTKQDVVGQHLLRVGRDRAKEYRPSVPLTHAEDDLLALGPSFVELFLAVLVLLEAADPRLVDLNPPLQLLEVRNHRFSEPVQHEPG